MIFAEDHARLLLLVHAILAAALVASCTHLVVWMRGFPRGQFQRLKAVRRFSRIAAVLFTFTFVAGNLIYPVYKVRVRAEYLDHPGAVARDEQHRMQARAQAQENHRSLTASSTAVPEHALPDTQAAVRGNLPRQTAKAARWFDVKEHWVALGTIMSLGCAALLWRWNPRDHGRAIASVAFLMALAAALAAWFGAIVGVVVTSYRAIGL